MLLCFTGIDGCGKTTQLEAVRAKLVENGRDIFISKAYSALRRAVVEPLLQSWNDTSVTFLFQALHTEQRFEAQAAIDRGQIVLADRWDESFLAYHAIFGELADQKQLRVSLNQMAFAGLKPERTFLFTLDPQIARQRKEARGHQDPFDNRPLEYFELIQNYYLKLAKIRQWTVINAAREIKEVHQDVWKTVRTVLSL